jgi:hypothetical protein
LIVAFHDDVVVIVCCLVARLSRAGPWTDTKEFWLHYRYKLDVLIVLTVVDVAFSVPVAVVVVVVVCDDVVVRHHLLQQQSSMDCDQNNTTHRSSSRSLTPPLILNLLLHQCCQQEDRLTSGHVNSRAENRETVTGNNKKAVRVKEQKKSAISVAILQEGRLELPPCNNGGTISPSLLCIGSCCDHCCCHGGNGVCIVFLVFWHDSLITIWPVQ